MVSSGEGGKGENVDEEVFIKKNNFVKVNCKRGKSEYVQNYIVL